MNNGPLLDVRGLTRDFGRLRAVNGVTFALAPGEALGVIGPNGSGKTTLVNLITGFVRPTKGTVSFKGRTITGLRPHRIARMGVGRTFQMARPYFRLRSLDNVVVPLCSGRVRKLAGGRYGGREAEAMDLLEEVGFERESLIPYKPASALPHGHLKRLELARCLALRPDLIILDEIFSGLSLAEVAGLAPIIERLRDQGVALIMVEHRLRELFRVTGRVMVMNFGRAIAQGTPAQVMEHPDVRAAYLGSE